MQKQFESRYTTLINAPVEKVWEALTNPAFVKQYFFNTDLVTDWVKGHPIFFRGAWEGQPYEDKGIVLEYSENKKLSYSYLSSWSGMEDREENYLYVSYEVQELENGTELTIIQTNYDNEKVEHSSENWKTVIEGMKKLLE
ncbi:MAG: SRPBCC domain-containing protein [Saprospiraceae bacterium]|jgi:uncharacterized protein YndB with AHSA1/START domain|nr:SRPBCC domain-containing protein [Saprospiraceae bacterium]